VSTQKNLIDIRTFQAACRQWPWCRSGSLLSLAHPSTGHHGCTHRGHSGDNHCAVRNTARRSNDIVCMAVNGEGTFGCSLPSSPGESKVDSPEGAVLRLSPPSPLS
jgi:hypothetical protein